MKINGRSLEILLFLSSRHREKFSGAELSKALQISSGTLYPLLVKLKEASMVEDEWEDGDASELGRPRRKFYSITGMGIIATQQRMEVLDPRYSQRQELWGHPALSMEAI
jgi:DNA-binding PadR family transcriptional regulator